MLTTTLRDRLDSFLHGESVLGICKSGGSNHMLLLHFCLASENWISSPVSSVFIKGLDLKTKEAPAPL